MSSRQPSPFGPHSVAVGLEYEAFAHLSEQDKKRLIRLMARIAEKSYRRGVQQGAALHDCPMFRDDLAEWRYMTPLDHSAWADSPYTETSVSRLFTENGELYRLGFNDGDQTPFGQMKPCWTGYSAMKRQQIKNSRKEKRHGSD